jgi:hypothetical protein
MRKKQFKRTIEREDSMMISMGNPKFSAVEVMAILWQFS